jgi:hypothetical protein
MTEERFVHHHSRLTFPRAILAGITLMVLGLIVVSGLLIQERQVLPRVTGYVLAVLSAISFLPVSREWVSPSYLELSGKTALVKWNNWRVSGNVAAMDFPAKKARRLVITLNQPRTLIDPVGPLFLLASFVLYPVMRSFVPSWWAPLYVINKMQLDAMLGVSPGGSLTVSFPTRIFGRRRMRSAVDNAAAEI